MYIWSRKPPTRLSLVHGIPQTLRHRGGGGLLAGSSADVAVLIEDVLAVLCRAVTEQIQNAARVCFGMGVGFTGLELATLARGSRLSFGLVGLGLRHWSWDCCCGRGGCG